MAAKTSMDEIEALPLPFFAYILMYECFLKGRFGSFLSFLHRMGNYPSGQAWTTKNISDISFVAEHSSLTLWNTASGGVFVSSCHSKVSKI